MSEFIGLHKCRYLPYSPVLPGTMWTTEHLLLGVPCMLESRWNVIAHGDSTGGKVKGKLSNGVDSQYISHYLETWCMQRHYHHYPWCTHLGCQYSTEWHPCQFKYSCPFRRKTKSSFCVRAITFQTKSTLLQVHCAPMWSSLN
jgi:hypothetical protein